MRLLVIFHGGCPDGTAALACVYKRFPEAEITATSFKYGGGFGMPEGHEFDTIYVLDVSFSAAVVAKIREKMAAPIVWIDHHLTTERAVAGQSLADLGVTLIYDVKLCGAALTWRHLFDADDAPPRLPDILRVVDAYDRHAGLRGFMRSMVLWLIVYTPLTVERVLALWDHPITMPAWKEEQPRIEAAEKMHDTVMRQMQMTVTARLGWLNEAGGVNEAGEEAPKHLAVRVSAHDKMGDLMLGKLRDKISYCRDMNVPEPEFAVYIAYNKYGVAVIMRSLADSALDLAAIAEQYGGGGHARAASFMMGHKRFNEVWKLTKRAEKYDN